jgi:hypothetical protein
MAADYAPLPYDAAFLQKQESAGCGRHALNNLLGGPYFVKGSNTPYTQEEIIQKGKDLSQANPVELMRVCQFLEVPGNAPTGYATKGGCPTTEDYDVSVLEYALNMSGYDQVLLTKGQFTDPATIPVNEQAKMPHILGYIINLGGVASTKGPTGVETAGSSGHWVSLRTNGATYTYKDSTHAAPEEVTLDKFKVDHLAQITDQSYILAVLERSLNTPFSYTVNSIDKISRTLREQLNIKQDATASQKDQDLNTFVSRFTKILEFHPEKVNTIYQNILHKSYTMPTDMEIQQFIAFELNEGIPKDEDAAEFVTLSTTIIGKFSTPDSRLGTKSQSQTPVSMKELTNWFTKRTVPTGFLEELRTNTFTDQYKSEIEFLEHHGLVDRTNGVSVSGSLNFYTPGGLFANPEINTIKDYLRSVQTILEQKINYQGPSTKSHLGAQMEHERMDMRSMLEHIKRVLSS